MFIIASSYFQLESTTEDSRTRWMQQRIFQFASYAARDGSVETEASLLSVFNTSHYPPRCVLTTLFRDYLACVIIRLSSRRAPVYCFFNFHSLAIIVVNAESFHARRTREFYKK